MTKCLRIAAVAALAAAASTASPADAAGPTPGCFGLAAKDKAGDQSATAPGAAQIPPSAPGSARENLDILETFFTSDGKEAALNFRVKNMSVTIPPGATAISWYLRAAVNGEPSWVRAMTDFTGQVFYDYGHFVPGVGVGVSEFSVRDGATTGEVFPGENGAVKVVLPPTAAGKAGTKIKPETWFAYEARQVLPAASPTPVKGGFLYEVDQATGKHEFTVGAPCPATAPAEPAPAAPGGPTTPPPAAPGDSGGPLPVKVLTRSAKRGKKITLKLKASEPITNLAAQIKKGSKVFGKGSLKRLAKSGRLTLKVKGLKRGTYVVDLAGTDGQGARRFISTRLKVK